MQVKQSMRTQLQVLTTTMPASGSTNRRFMGFPSVCIFFMSALFFHSAELETRRKCIIRSDMSACTLTCLSLSNM